MQRYLKGAQYIAKEYKNESLTRRSKTLTKGRKSRSVVTQFELIDVKKLAEVS